MQLAASRAQQFCTAELEVAAVRVVVVHVARGVEAAAVCAVLTVFVVVPVVVIYGPPRFFFV